MAIQKAHEDDSAMFVPSNIARRAASLSSCRRRQVGAAVFDLNGQLLATGHNQERPGDEGSRSCAAGDCPRGMASYTERPADSPYSDCIADHAEIVALGKAYGTPLQEAWFPHPDIVMVVTHKPCHECTDVLEALDFLVFYLEEL